MTTPVGMPNYQQLRQTLAGVETVRGTKATKTNKWYGALDLTRRQPLAESEEFAGTFFGDYTPVRGAVMVDGTYRQNMAYEDAFLFRYAVKGGVTGTSDGQATPGYTYPFRYSGTRDDLDTASVECLYGGMTWESEGLVFPEFTISADIDDPQAVWKWSSRAVAISKDLKAGLDDVAATSGTTTTFVKTGWAQTVSAHVGKWAHFKSGTAGNIGLFREITANDATSITFAALPSAVTAADVIDIYALPTAGISDRTRENVQGPGTVLYMDASGGTIGTTPITGRLISFSVTGLNPATYKRFMENVSTTSNKVDLGMRRVSGQLRLEFDRKREWDKYKALSPELIRIRQTGTVINTSPATNKTATIDIYRAIYDDPTVDTRGNNVVATWPFRGYIDSTQGVAAEFVLKNALSSLLA
jgi:hypothetical protein